MRIALCDDDEVFLDTIYQYINEYFNKLKIKEVVIKRFSDGENLLLCEEQFDIIFIDVEMNGLNGIETSRRIKKRFKDTIIFIITSYNDYLDETMRQQLFRFLTKPLDKNRLFRNLHDAILIYNEKDIEILIENKDGVYKRRIGDIILIESKGRKVIIHTVDGDYESSKSIQQWAEELKQGRFFQTHRSFIVNMDYVTEFTHENINLCNGEYIAFLTRRKYTSFKNAYLLYLEKTR